jgi:hypothetical protein
LRAALLQPRHRRSFLVVKRANELDPTTTGSIATPPERRRLRPDWRLTYV